MRPAPRRARHAPELAAPRHTTRDGAFTHSDARWAWRRLLGVRAVSKRRLQLLVLQRNRMLKYLRREQRERYTSVIAGLSIRPNKNFDPTIKPRKTTWTAKRGTSRRSAKAKHRPYGEPTSAMLTRPPSPLARVMLMARLSSLARVTGEEKNAKGRTRLRIHAVRQKRVQRARDAAARAEQRAAAAAASSSAS